MGEGEIEVTVQVEIEARRGARLDQNRGLEAPAVGIAGAVGLADVGLRSVQQQRVDVHHAALQ